MHDGMVVEPLRWLYRDSSDRPDERVESGCSERACSQEGLAKAEVP